MKRLALAALLTLLGAVSAGAQTVDRPISNAGVYGAYNSAPPTCTSGQGCWLQTDVNGNLLVAGTFSATLAGFTPNGNYATLTATAASSASTALPAGAVVAFQNTSTVDVSCVLSAGAATATTNKIVVRGGSTIFVTVGSNVNTACIDQTGSASNVVAMAGGAGLGTGFGGGSSSGGGGGAITAAIGSYATGALSAGAFASGAGVDGWDLTEGTKADAAWVSGSGSVISLLKNIAGEVAGPVTAGTAIIGKVGIDQTTPGTTNGVVDAATSATGSSVPAKAGYVGVIDAVGGNLAGLTGDPCQTSVKSSLPITLATAAVKVIATGVSAKKIYVCAIDLTNNAADSVAVFEATTGTTCVTSPVAVTGAGTSVATAATGYNFAANGGISKGNGGFQVMQTTVNNNDLCIAQSAATQLTGNITYVTR